MVSDIKKLTRQQLTESIKKTLKESGMLSQIQNAVKPQPQVQQAPVTEPEVLPHAIEDETGTIFIVKMPIEGCEISHLIDECSIMDLNHKLSTGELQKEGISAICKSSASASRKAGKLIQGFHTNLIKSRKSQLKELKNKKKYWESRVDMTNELHGGEEMLDEAQKGKLSRIRQGLEKYDKQIIELENLLRAHKDADKIEPDDK